MCPFINEPTKLHMFLRYVAQVWIRDDRGQKDTANVENLGYEYIMDTMCTSE